MSNYLSLGIVLLSSLAYMSLQLNLGCLLLLYHASVGKHIRAKSRTLATGYIFGVMIFLFLALSAACFLLLVLQNGALELWQISALAGALLATAILIWLVYYRFGGATELWLPRSFTNFLHARARATKNPVEAFSLGFVSCFAELPFSAFLILLSANSILTLPQVEQFLAILGFILISILPLLLLRIFLRKGSSISAVQRWRSKNRIFIRIFSGLLFLTLGIFIFVFEVKGGL